LLYYSKGSNKVRAFCLQVSEILLDDENNSWLGSNSHDIFGGSGLGLFVSRKLCDLMGGNIDVDSVYGEGANFRFYITAIAVESPSNTPDLNPSSTSPHKRTKLLAKSRSQRAVEANRVPSVPTSQTAYHILITEDNLINQTVLNRQLKQAGFTTALASNGLQAIEQIKKLAKGNNAAEGVPRQFSVILVSEILYLMLCAYLIV